MLLWALIQVAIGQVTGQPSETVTDADGNVYQTVQIGNQIWMAENLRTTKCSGGTPISLISDGKQWGTSNDAAYTWSSHVNTEDLKRKYGALYNAAAVNSACNICPNGWSIPTQQDFMTLLNNLNPGAHLKLIDPNYWGKGKLKTEGKQPDNSSGWSALPAGGQDVYKPESNDFGDWAYFWSKSPRTAETGWTFVIHPNDAGAQGASWNKVGLSVRCIKELRVVPNTSDSYVVELLGRQGTLEFPAPIATKPTSANLTIPIGNTSTKFEISGSWDNNGVFSGRIMQGTAPANLPGTTFNNIRLRQTPGTYSLTGAICYNNTNSWMVGSTLVLGYKSKNLMVKSTAKPLFALVVNDKHADSDKGSYSYGWYIEPSKATSDNFRMVHLVLDDVLNEVALYAFENKDYRTEQDAPAFKMASYKINEITANLNTLFDRPSLSDITADLGTLLLNFAQLKYPSQHLGLKSSGHGSPHGIMNGFFNEDYTIARSLGWVKEMRGENISFLDFSTNCNVASFFNLVNVAPYVDYIVASDLTRSSPLPFSLYGQRPDSGGNYFEYFKDESQPIATILGSIIDKYGSLFNSDEAINWAKSPDALKNGRTLDSWKQQLTLFDMARFPQILQNMGGKDAYTKCQDLIKTKSKDLNNLYFVDYGTKYLDFKTAVPLLYPGYTAFTQDWEKFAIKQISNRQQFVWDTDAPKGLTITRKWD